MKNKTDKLNEIKSNNNPIQGNQNVNESSTNQNQLSNEELNDSSKIIEELKSKLDEMKEKHLRALADYDNLRKRSQKEISNAKEIGKLEFIVELLPFIDSLENAVKHNNQLESLMNQLFSILTKNKVLKYPSEEEIKEFQFDPNLYEVVSIAQTNEKSLDNKISEVVQFGYKSDNKILRHAKIVLFKFFDNNNVNPNNEKNQN
ncbi:MAG: nucleotide exchange factor GrpE [Candidatus Anstonellales archaeon]